MIIVCPKCSTRYIVPDGSVGEAGRKMRCNNCDELWTQMPGDENSSEHESIIGEDINPANTDTDSDSLDDVVSENPDEQIISDEEALLAARGAQLKDNHEVAIPQSIRPDQKDRAGRLISAKGHSKLSWKSYAVSSAAACVLLGAGLFAFLSTAEKTALEHQKLRPIFAAFGKDPYGKVENLTFDQVMLVYNTRTHSFDFSGALINLEKRPVILPMAKVVFSDNYKLPLDVWDIALLNAPLLKGEDSAYFEFSYPMDEAISKKVATITVEFAGGSKPYTAEMKHELSEKETHDAPSDHH
jgi:predicted Zn finger-like uncharacterized protein